MYSDALILKMVIELFSCRLGKFELTDTDLEGPSVQDSIRAFCAALSHDIASQAAVLSEQTCKAVAVIPMQYFRDESSMLHFPQREDVIEYFTCGGSFRFWLFCRLTSQFQPVCEAASCTV